MTGATRSPETGASWTIRAVVPTDLDEVVALCGEHAVYERASFCPAGKAEALARHWQTQGRRAGCWVVDSPEGLQGYATFGCEFSTWDAADFLHLDCLYLRPAYRRRGVGAAILRRLQDRAIELGCVNLQWQTPDWNAGAIRFYQRHGAQVAAKARFTLPVGDYQPSVSSSQ